MRKQVGADALALGLPQLVKLKVSSVWSASALCVGDFSSSPLALILHSLGGRATAEMSAFLFFFCEAQPILQ